MKISVVVPIYNVEPYIKRCIDSILNQTYKDLDIILVDDGSPDRCGEICDEYALIDPRIRVIHKVNGGLSDARNSGIKIAEGEYIGFVDGDDFIAPDMYEHLFNLISNHNADISVCGIYYTNGVKRKAISKLSTELVLTPKQAIKEILEETKFSTSACDKLFKRSLFQDVLFPEGKLFEDLYTIYKLFNKANCIAYSPEPKYHYVINQESIMNSSFNGKKFDDFKAASEELINFVASEYPDLRKSAVNRFVRYNIGFIRQIIRTNSSDLDEIARKMINNIRENLLSYLWSQYKLSSKLFGMVLSISYPLTKFTYIGSLMIKKIMRNILYRNCQKS